MKNIIALTLRFFALVFNIMTFCNFITLLFCMYHKSVIMSVAAVAAVAMGYIAAKICSDTARKLKGHGKVNGNNDYAIDSRYQNDYAQSQYNDDATTREFEAPTQEYAPQYSTSTSVEQWRNPYGE